MVHCPNVRHLGCQLRVGKENESEKVTTFIVVSNFAYTYQFLITIIY